MCGGGNKGQSSSTSTTTSPFQGAYTNLINSATGTAATPYTPYAGQRVAGFTPDQNAAFQSVDQTQGLGQPYVNQANSYLQQGAAPVTNQSIQAAYNPFIQSQVDALQANLGHQNAQTTAASNSNAAKMGALTGDRSQVANQIATNNNNLNAATATSGLLSNAYGQAAGLAQGNQQAALSGAGISSGLGQTAQNLALQGSQAQLATGGLQQQLAQAQLDVPYQQYLTQQAYPFQTQQWLASLYGGVGPLGGSTTSGTQTPAQPSIWSQILGAAATAGGAFMGASDARIKENITPLGPHPDTGHMVYQFNFKGDPTPQVGFIAQDVEQTQPQAVATDPQTGIKSVDYARASNPDQAAFDAYQASMRQANQAWPPASIPSNSAPSQGRAIGGEVDPDFAKMVSHLGHAVQALKPHVNGYAAGGNTLGEPVQPLGFQAPSFTLPQVSQAGYVPQSTMGGASHLQSSPLPQSQSPQSQDMGLNKAAGAIGKYYGTPEDYGNPMGEAESLAGWFPGTTVTPAARGGPIHGYDNGGGVGFGLGSRLAAIAHDDDPQQGGFSAPQLPFQLNPSGVPGISTEGAFPGSYVPPPAVDTGNSGLGDQTGSAQTQPQAQPSYLGASDVTPPSNTDQAGWVNGKNWYEPGSNPDLGAAIAMGGAQAMASGSPWAGIGIGKGIAAGIEQRYGQLNADREYRMKEKQADLTAQALMQRISQEKQLAPIELATKQMNLEQEGAKPVSMGMNSMGLPIMGVWNNKNKKYEPIQGAGDAADGLPIATDSNGKSLPLDDYLKQIPDPGLRGKVGAVLRGDDTLAAISARNPYYGQGVQRLVYNFDPIFNPTQAQNRVAIEKDLASTKQGHLGALSASIGKMGEHLNQLVDASQSLQTTPVILWNRTTQMFDTQTGSPQVPAFQAAANVYMHELAKVLKGGSGVPTDADMEGLAKFFSAPMSRDQLRGVLSTWDQAAHAAIDGVDSTNERSIGHTYDASKHSVITPFAQKQFDKLDSNPWLHPQQGQASQQQTEAHKKLLALPDGPVTLGGKNYVKKGSILTEVGP